MEGVVKKTMIYLLAVNLFSPELPAFHPCVRVCLCVCFLCMCLESELPRQVTHTSFFACVRVSVFQ